MVILGGLELVAAGYILSELNKDNKKERERRNRKDDRKHHHQHESPPRKRPQQNLSPSQVPPPRPHSAPPPGHPPPMWQPLPVPYPPQYWQPQPQPQHAPYPPSWQPQPPPQGYLDLKTGKVQQNLYPPDHPLARSAEQTYQYNLADHGRPRGEFDFDNPSGPPPQPGITAQHNNQAQPQANMFPGPRPG